MQEKIDQIAQWLGTGSINIFGRPFSGKDTQGARLSQIFNAPLIGGGDILRTHQEPAEIEQFLAKGGIIPSDYYLDLILPYLSQEQIKNYALILSSVGRAHGEEKIILKACQQANHAIKAVLYLDIPENQAWQRFKLADKLGDRGLRSDDQADSLRERLYKFKQKTLPVINYYKKAGLLVEVDGQLSREEVTHEIIDKLYKFSKKH